MYKPVCVKCEVEYRPHKNGVYVKEIRLDGSFYKLWSADIWKCPGCGHELVWGYGHSPLVQDHQLLTSPELKSMLQKAEEDGVILCKEKYEKVC